MNPQDSENLKRIADALVILNNHTESLMLSLYELTSIIKDGYVLVKPVVDVKND